MTAVEHYTAPDEPTPPEELEAGARVLVRRFFVKGESIIREEELLCGTVDHIPDWEAITDGQVALSGARTYFHIAPDGEGATKAVHYTDWPAICSGQRCVLRTYFYLLSESSDSE